MGQVPTSQSAQPQQPQNELALSLEPPSHTSTSQRQPQQQQAQMSVVESKQLNVLGDSSSSNDSPETPHLNPAAGAGQSYVSESWSEIEAAYGQQIMSSQGYSGNSMMLPQGGDTSYVHQTLQQQHQHQHQHQQTTAPSAQAYHHLPHGHHHVHVPQSQHKGPISYMAQRPTMQEYSHPQQVQMHPAHGHAHPQYAHSAGYGGYTASAVENRPHLVIDGMSMGQTQAGPGSQPPSAVAMGDPNTYYAANVNVNATPIQPAPSSSMFGAQHPQHEYAQSWHPSQGQDYYGYN
ncbi:hypothetical protein FRC19_005637 [Serendipita sp. 401]|nr:hypothetical protein FRC19_005637 [Serendipita sp. 401]